MDAFPWGFILPLVGIAVPLFAFLWEFVIVGRKRLGWRVQMDTTLTGQIESEHGGVLQTLLQQEAGKQLDSPSFVLLRVENNGATTISEADYTMPDAGLEVVFPGRKVVGLAVTELSDDSIRGSFESDDPGKGLDRTERADAPGQTSGIVKLPKVTLNRGWHYKVLVLLERVHEKHSRTTTTTQVVAGLEGGTVRETHNRTGPSRRGIVLITFLVLVIIAQLGTSMLDDNVPLDCASGELKLVGSTAFGPVMEEAARSYRNTCPQAVIATGFHGSAQGLREMQQAGSSGVLAFTDGAKSEGYPQLLPRPVAFTLFTLVANKDAGVADLTLEQVRRIYDGQIGNWKDVGGKDLPVRLVSRDPDSGTRKTFQGQVLSGKREPGTNSDDCKQLDSGAVPGVVRCERPSTNDVLNTVALTSGALGYSELGAVTHRQDVVPVRISGHEATLEGAVHAAYPFWQTEYAYTFGEPKADSLAASFLRYLTNQVGRDIIRSHGNRPCGELENPVLCRPE